MKSYHRLHENSWLLLVFLVAVAFLSAGCSSSSSDSGGNLNPLGAYQPEGTTSGLVVDGVIKNPGEIDSPIVTVPTDGTTIDGHENAPLLDNMHPGWQQAACLSCHNDASRNPDHSYTDASLCYLCHGTNGLPGFGDNVPPVISGVVINPTESIVTISWKSDEECTSRLVLRTLGGDRLEFPVSMTYKTSHKYEIAGLVPETYYTYELICTDKSGNKSTSANFGILSFTTPAKTTSTTTTTTSTGTDTTTDNFFSNVAIEADGPFAVRIKFKVSSPSTCEVFFLDKATGTLAEQENLGNVTSEYDKKLSGYAAGSVFLIVVQATETGTGKTYNTAKYEVKIEDL
ncbi:MAG: hypothetical protein EOM80_05230 [Erysipelotrichia bacterium]|nr:hypothetical protein [Erysipelotrichia bacterium]